MIYNVGKNNLKIKYYVKKMIFNVGKVYLNKFHVN